MVLRLVQMVLWSAVHLEYWVIQTVDNLAMCLEYAMVGYLVVTMVGMKVSVMENRSDAILVLLSGLRTASRMVSNTVELMGIVWAVPLVDLMVDPLAVRMAARMGIQMVVVWVARKVVSRVCLSAGSLV